MAALDLNALVIEYGNLWVGDDAGSIVDMGSLRNLRFTAEPITTTVNSDNRGEVIRKSRLVGRIEADLLEPGDVDKLENLFKGIVTKSTNASTPVSNHSQVVSSGSWSFNTFIAFTYQDGDGTAPNIDSVTGATDSTLTVNVDYIVTQHQDGRWGIMILDSSTVTTTAQNVTIQYDYTPAASKVLTGGTNQTATPRYVKIIAPSEDDSNVTREIVLSSAHVTSPMLLAFVDVENANDVAVMPLVIEATKGSTFTITDEVNAS